MPRHSLHLATSLDLDGQEISDTLEQMVGEQARFFRCSHQKGSVEIEAMLCEAEKPCVVAKVFGAKEMTADLMADKFVSAVNDHEQMKAALAKLLSALDHCIESGGLSWEVEQEAENVSMGVRQSGLLTK